MSDDDDLAPWRKLGDVLGKILDGVAREPGREKGETRNEP